MLGFWFGLPVSGFRLEWGFDHGQVQAKCRLRISLGMARTGLRLWLRLSRSLLGVDIRLEVRGLLWSR